MNDMEQTDMQSKTQPTSSRILYDIPCRVCQDHSSGKHYGIFACDGCAGFFKRSIRRNKDYHCRAKVEGACLMDKIHRNQCRACRLKKCLEAGMNKDAVQHERGPRNSTLRKQMCLLMKPEAGPSMDTPKPPPPHFFPPPPPSVVCPQLTEVLTEPETISEWAAKVLYMNTSWAKNVPSFTALSTTDQLILLEETWGELFMLGCAQWMPPIDLTSLARGGLLRDATMFQKTLSALRSLQLDTNEYCFLRAILLFKTALQGEGKTLTDIPTVATFQNYSQITLSKYMSATYPDRPYRFGKVLLYLPALRAISPSAIEELFFKNYIGTAPIGSIIRGIYMSTPSISNVLPE